MKRNFYSYKGNLYEYVGVSSFKHPENRDWIPCVTYVCLKTGKFYNREVNEFHKLFEPITKFLTKVKCEILSTFKTY